MPRLSILIPALGKLEPLETSLVSLLENRPADCEIVAVLDHDYADPYDLKDEVRFVAASRRAGLVEAVNLGLAACRSNVVHLLAAGASVSEGWAEPALAHFGDPRIAAVAPLVLDPASGLVVTAGLEYHPAGRRVDRAAGRPADVPAARVLGASAQAAFYRASALGPPGQAFDEQVGEALADVDLALRLKEAGYLAVFEPLSRIHHQPTASASAVLDGARQAERLFWRHVGARGWAGALASHAALVAAEFASGLGRGGALARLSGRLLGSCEWGQHLRGRLKLALPPAGGTPSQRPDRPRPHLGSRKRQGVQALEF